MLSTCVCFSYFSRQLPLSFDVNFAFKMHLTNNPPFLSKFYQKQTAKRKPLQYQHMQNIAGLKNRRQYEAPLKKRVPVCRL